MSWLFNSIAKLITGNFDSGVGKFAQNVASSLSAKYLGTGLTGAEKEANKWTAQREDTFHQRTVADMQAAGLNPALMYGNGASGASPSASVSPGSADPVSLIQLATLPEQLKQMKAQTQQILADADLKRADKQYRESQTNYQNLINEAFPERNAKELAQIGSITNYQEAAAALAWANTEFRNKESEYYDAFADMKLALEDAQKSNYESDSALKDVHAAFEEIQRAYAESTGFLMSSSEKVAIVQAICGLLGVKKEDAQKVFSDALQGVKDGAQDIKRRYDESKAKRDKDKRHRERVKRIQERRKAEGR